MQIFMDRIRFKRELALKRRCSHRKRHAGRFTWGTKPRGADYLADTAQDQRVRVKAVGCWERGGGNLLRPKGEMSQVAMLYSLRVSVGPEGVTVSKLHSQCTQASIHCVSVTSLVFL